VDPKPLAEPKIPGPPVATDTTDATKPVAEARIPVAPVVNSPDAAKPVAEAKVPVVPVVGSPDGAKPLAEPKVPVPPVAEAVVSPPGKAAADQDAAIETLLDAAWDGSVSAVTRALQFTPATSCDLKGLTALHLAAERDHLAVAMLLLDRGADIHAHSNGGRTPLHLAARKASADMVDMLLERGKAKVGAVTTDGKTALHYAASAAEDGDEERREVLRTLRDAGADPTVRDRKDETPRDVAQKRGFFDAAATLRRAEKRWEEDHKQNWLQRHGLLKK
jgi:hypothetical protein